MTRRATAAESRHLDLRALARGEPCASCGRADASGNKPLAQRLAEKVRVRPDGCWEWAGARAGRGYGYFTTYPDRRNVYVHRAVYETYVGPIPVGHHICHRCDNPWCCNPGHLFAGTHYDNMRDMLAKGRQPRQMRPGQGPGKKLAMADVEAIRASSETVRALAARYGVHHSAIWKVKTRQTYAEP